MMTAMQDGGKAGLGAGHQLQAAWSSLYNTVVMVPYPCMATVSSLAAARSLAAPAMLKYIETICQGRIAALRSDDVVKLLMMQVCDVVLTQCRCDYRREPTVTRER